MRKSIGEVHFETRRHASGTYTTNYPPSRQQGDDGGGRSFLSRGITQIKERWTGYRNPKKLQRYAALFISPNTDRLAVASKNKITLLHKENDYREPSGIFTEGSIGIFTCGAWSEAHDVLGVVDDSDTLYFIKASGEEITRISGKNLKVSLPILGLIFRNDSDLKKACLCSFSILTSDGLLHDIEISQDLSASFLATHLSHTGLTLKKHIPKITFCTDYHPQLSLFATVNSDGGFSFSKAPEHPGLCSLSLWRRSSSSILELIISTEFEGSYSAEKSYTGRSTSPKVLISPQGKFIATVDVRGCLVTFKFDQEQCTLSKFYSENPQDIGLKTDVSSRGTDSLNGVVDFTWWSDEILAVVEQDGRLMMFDVPTGVKLLKNGPVYSMPLLGTGTEVIGHLFILGSRYSEQSYDNLEGKELNDMCIVERMDFSKLQWNLFSLSERSVSEMYDLLIHDQDYQAALSFADRYMLDKDEVLKAQWASSGQGVREINKLLSTIKDKVFVLSQCVDCVGPTEDAAMALLAYGLHLTDSYRFSELEEDKGSLAWDFRLERLKLLSFRDRLETFLGINMGRFSAEEYKKFRSSPINKAAAALAENGKIGALNLLFKRHPYSLSPSILEVLDAIPETVLVQSYAQLLPGNSPPESIAMREEDWVECEKMILFTEGLPEYHHSRIFIRTELILKKSMGFQWPSTASLSLWYKNRARDIDILSGQLDNCMSLIDFACRQGIPELQHFLEDITYLHQLIYFTDHLGKVEISHSLVDWEKLPDYEKFKLMLVGGADDNIIQKLQESAIPFMQKRDFRAITNFTNEPMSIQSSLDMTADSFLVRWLTEISMENKLELCLLAIEEGCKDLEHAHFFKDEVEVADCALKCIYLCPCTDRWSTMASILSKLPPIRELGDEILKTQLKVAEGHIESGKLLAFYQVPKPMNFFREAYTEERAVKQILRLILSKFIRRQLGRLDNDWATLWHDLQSLQEKAFPFLDLEYVLIEFCRGLLKAGKFSLARNYLKGTSSVVLAADKAENLIIQAAREYFFSASSLDSPEVWKAKDCLNILPSSRNVRAEADMIDAFTVKLPNLGVHILPLQFKQMKNPFEIIKLAITSQSGAYLNVEELIEIAKLLGLSSQEDISAVQEAIAREAAKTGDVQLAFDLCLVLAKKGHGSVWDLCLALARSPSLENMDVNARKHLLGFSLSYCDEESISELLNAWKDLDMQSQCENLIMLTGSEPPDSPSRDNLTISYPLCETQGSADTEIWSGRVDVGFGDLAAQFNVIKDVLSSVAKDLALDNGYGWESLLKKNRKILYFAALRLPWLLELISKAETPKKHRQGLASSQQYLSVRTQAILTIISWLARNSLIPRDVLITSVAKSIMESPVTEDEDIIGCSFLLNLVDAFSGVDIIEGFVKERENYHEITSIMNVGMIYGLLHNHGFECEDASQRRALLLREFQQKHKSVASDERDELDKAQTAFWREWKVKLEQQKHAADQSRVLEQIIPGVETARFLSGDSDYIESVLSSVIESVKLEPKHILTDILNLSNMYGVDRSKVLLHFMSIIFVSEAWAVGDIVTELSEFRKELISSADDVIKVITLSVYPVIDGRDKQRLAYMYDLLSDCYLQLELNKTLPNIVQYSVHMGTPRLSQILKTFGQECYRLSFISSLDFKNIAGLQDLSRDCFNDEVCSHITENNVEALANMVHVLIGIYGDRMPQGLLKCQDVYYRHVLNLLSTLKPGSNTESHNRSPEELHCLVNEFELAYDVFRKYLKFIECSGISEIMKLFFSVTEQFEKPAAKYLDSMWLECVVKLLNLWLKLLNDLEEIQCFQNSDKKCSECLMTCVKVFLNLIVKGEVSVVEGWGTVIEFSKSGLTGDPAVEVSDFCGAMILAGCRFQVVANVFTDALSQLSLGSCSLQDLPHLYLIILGRILLDLEKGSPREENLYYFLSSLCKFEGNLEDLTSVRLAVWNKMAEVSDNFQLPSHIRVCILELMQQIAATGKQVKDFSYEPKDSVLPWEGWENVQNTTAYHEKTNDVDLVDTANRFTSTLVALKSSQLLSAISPLMEIVPEDLFTIESAVSCFLKVSESAKSESHIDALIAILAEWEDLFVSGVKDSPKVDDGGNSWSNDDWDEGWESLAEEPSKKEISSSSSLSVHPLHTCWMEIFKKLVRLSRCRDILKLIDKYKGRTMQMLLDENDICNLCRIVLDLDCFLALKIMLLLPHEAMQLHCLEAVEGKLKQEGVPEELGRDHEFLILLLSSGIISTVINNSSYGTTFSYLCCVVGNFSRWCQEAQFSSLKYMTTMEDGNRSSLIFLFTRLLFPCFLAELVQAGQQILAGFLVTKFMHTSASLSLVNVAGSSLRMYFEKQLQLSEDDESCWEGLKPEEHLPNNISILRDRLRNLIQPPLSLLLGQDR